MTICLPLGAASPPAQVPHFVIPSADPPPHVQRVVKAILRAKRIAVLCGAGISVQAGIPDFRSETGLFQTLKKENSTLSSGRDLFDASVFNSEATTALFCKMIARLALDSKVAHPTPFHHMLRALDNRGRLLRVYSQNIDALEQKAGLTFGVPEPELKRYKPRSSKGSPEAAEGQAPASTTSANGGVRLPTPPAETPRCIPLHGTVQNMHCQICLHSFPLENYLEELNVGELPICPDCSQMEETRQAIGKRSRGVGKLRPSVVLYNELHKDGEEVGDVVQKDLLGNSKGKGRLGPDLLIVVGTSLRVPGTKRMVREFSKALHSRVAATSASQGDSPPSSQASSSQRSSPDEEDAPIKTIYLNLDFPVPTREWEGVFDVWVRGDAQEFAKLVQDEIEREEQAKLAAIERKKRREEMRAAAALAAEVAEKERVKAGMQSKVKGKRKENGKKSKGVGKASQLTLGKRKADCTPDPRPAKRSKLHAGPEKSKTGHSKTKTGVSSKKGLTVKFSGQAWSEAIAKKSCHRPPTPPPSQGRRNIDTVVPAFDSSSSNSPLSPPLSTPTMSPPMPEYSGFSSPLSQITSSMASCFSSPLSSPLSSPSLSTEFITKAYSPTRHNVYPPTPDFSPLSSPPPTRMPSTGPAPFTPSARSPRRLSASSLTSPLLSRPLMRRRSSSFKTIPPPLNAHLMYPVEDDIVDVEAMSGTEEPSLSQAHVLPTLCRPPTRPGLRPRLPPR